MGNYNPLPEEIGILGGKSYSPPSENGEVFFDFTEEIGSPTQNTPTFTPPLEGETSASEDGVIVDARGYTTFSFSEEDKTILVENQFSTKATQINFGLMKPGKGLMAITPGVIEVKIGKGLKFNESSGKLELELIDFYPLEGHNISYTKDEAGKNIINVKGEDELNPSSERVPTSKSVANYMSEKMGEISDISQSLKEEGDVTIVDVLNTLHKRDHYTHSQLSPSAAWIINHPLKKKPSVTITNENGIEVIGEIEYPSIEQVIVKFSASFSGSALLN